MKTMVLLPIMLTALLTIPCCASTVSDRSGISVFDNSGRLYAKSGLADLVSVRFMDGTIKAGLKCSGVDRNTIRLTGSGLAVLIIRKGDLFTLKLANNSKKIVESITFPTLKKLPNGNMLYLPKYTGAAIPFDKISKPITLTYPNLTMDWLCLSDGSKTGHALRPDLQKKNTASGFFFLVFFIISLNILKKPDSQA